MTADERIELLITQAGQTLADLPWRHEESTLAAVRKAAAERAGHRFAFPGDTSEYAAHLVDVIDRMELALEAALMRMPKPKSEIVREVFGADNLEERADVPDEPAETNVMPE